MALHMVRSGRSRLPILLIVAAVALSLLGTARACPSSSNTNGLDGSVYTCTANDDASCEITAGELHTLNGTFQMPERTGSVLAEGGLSLTVRCAAVKGQGKSISADGLSATVRGCHGDPVFPASGSGAVVVVSTIDAACLPSDCTCSYSGQTLDTDFAGSMSTAYVSGQDAQGEDINYLCTCVCRKYSCAVTISADKKKGEVAATDGNDLQTGHEAIKTAGSCVIDAGSYGCNFGYLDGQTFTAYTEAIDVTMSDANDPPMNWSADIGGSLPSISDGVYSYPDIFVDKLAIYTKELTLTFTATGTNVDGEAISATKGTFIATASCSDEPGPWKVTASDLTVTAGYAALLHGCAGAVSGTERLWPTVKVLVNSTFRIAPGARAGTNTNFCIDADAFRVVDVTGINRDYSGSRVDDLNVVSDPGSIKLCEDGILKVSGLENKVANVIINEAHDLTVARYRGIGTAVVGTKAFFAGGFIHGGSWTNRIDIFQLNSKTWTTATLSEARYGIAGASLRHIAMFFGGCSSTGFYGNDKVDMYNNVTDQWSSTTISKGRWWGAATGVGDVILFAGGRDAYNAELDDVDIYNIGTEAWTSASLSQGRCCLAAVTVGNMALFAGGGTHSRCKINCDRDNEQSDAVDLYNSATGTWTTATLSEARAFPAGAVHGTKAFFAGGDTTGTTDQSKRVDIYDSATGVWSTAELSAARTTLGAAASGNAVLFVGGADRDNSNPTNLIDVYDVEAGVWSVKQATATRYSIASVTVGDYAMFAGGFSGSSDTTKVELMKYESVIQVYATVNASSASGSIHGRYTLPLEIDPLGINISLPTAPTEATDHAMADAWNIQCNTTFNGKLNQNFVLGADDLVCIAANGLCPVDKYSTGQGVASDITNCLHCPTLTTTAGTGSTSVSDCKCMRGYTGPDEGPCTACIAGKYKDAIGSSGCTLCPAGKHSSATGANNSSMCLACPDNALSLPGSTLVTHCFCNVGYTGPDGETCVACVAGKFKTTNGTADCTQCATGKFSSSTGVTSDVCEDCGHNYYSSSNNSHCIPSTPVTTPTPLSTIICPDDTKPFTINGINLCMPPKLFPASNVSHCVFDKTWEDIQANRYIYQTGGLGKKMQGEEWKVWVCGAQLPCAIQTHDWVCFTYNEFHDVFVPLGHNRELLIVRKC